MNTVQKGSFNVGEYEAVGIIEGFLQNPGATPEEEYEVELRAWQTIIDSGLVWKLQGRFGRQAVRLIEEGICTRPTIKAD
jgi:hypothetical protein